MEASQSISGSQDYAQSTQSAGQLRSAAAFRWANAASSISRVAVFDVWDGSAGPAPELTATLGTAGSKSSQAH